MRVPVVVALSGGLLLSGLGCTAQTRPTPSPPPIKVRTSSPSSQNDIPLTNAQIAASRRANTMMSLTIIIPLLVMEALVCVPIGLIFFWLIKTIDKRQGK